MQLSYLSLTFAIIIVMSIMHAPEIEARAFSETDAVSESEAGFGSWLLKKAGDHLVKIMKELKEERGPGPHTWNTMKMKLIQEYPYLVKEITEELKKNQ